MNATNVIFYVPPITFTIVALAFFLLWRLKVTAAWQWSAGFAQTAIGFMLSTFLSDATFAAFASGVIFIGAAYCYGSGLMIHFGVPGWRKPRLAFVAAYMAALAYLVFAQQSLVSQLFVTDIGFALLLGFAVLMVARRASRPVDVALVVAASIVVLDSVIRAVFFTFFTNMSDSLGDFANSLYNIQVSITTVSVCMFFPFLALGASASAAIERHRAAAETDELTGLLNRRGFGHALQAQLSGNGLFGAVVVCDLDHFKRINDTYGHGAGDQVIRGLAEEMRRLVGPNGRAARYGGEEFAAFLPGATLDEATSLAEMLRVAFSSRDWSAHGIAQAVTVSCGVSPVRTGESSLENAINRADKALYAAKSAGRNRVTHDESLPQPKRAGFDHPAAVAC